MEHLFIVNPAAGRGKPLKFIPQIESIFKDRDEKYHMEITEKPGHATQIAREYVKTRDLRVYSVGGDGTLNEVLNGMAGSGSSLAIIPGGSGNDFVKSFCASPKADDILRRTVEGRERSMDLAKVNDRYFINIASVGFDANVASNTNKHRSIYGFLGNLTYVTGVLETILHYRNFPVHICVDGSHLETTCLLAAVANGKYYGGGMKPAPEAEIDDGLLDVCLIEGKTRPEILKFLPRFMQGRHGEIRGVRFFKGKEIFIECEEEVLLNVDGESQTIQKAVLSVIHHGIRVVVPDAG